MKNWKYKLSWSAVFLLVGAYFFFFSLGFVFYLWSSLLTFSSESDLPWRGLVGWLTVGLSLSLLASLFAWPFALSIVTLLEHNKLLKSSRYFLSLASYLSTLPLVFFVYFYVEIIGLSGFELLKQFWIFSFASPNFLTQSLAFALTLLLYPLTAIPGFANDVSVDLFFQDMLAAVIEFAEVGLVASVVVLGLFLYVLPKMVLNMRQQLKEDDNIRSFEIIKSIGGTPWESIHLTTMQSMKNRFNCIIIHFTRLCFFEGLITFSLLSYFFLRNEESHYQWSMSLTSQLTASMLNFSREDPLLLWIPGVLVIFYVCFLLFEFLTRFNRGGQDV